MHNVAHLCAPESKVPDDGRSSLEAFSSLWPAYGEGRLDGSLELVEPDCEVTFLDGDPARGHDGVRACLAAARREWKTLTIVYEDHPSCVVGSGHLAASSPARAHVDRAIGFVAQFRGERLARARVPGRDDAIGAARDLRRAGQRPA